MYISQMINCIIEGCPKLKTLSLGSVRENWDLSISKERLEALFMGCNELKHLKLTKAFLEDLFNEGEIKKIWPHRNVEIEQCEFDDLDNSSWISDYFYDSNDWFDNNHLSNSLDVSFNDGEQYCNFEGSNKCDDKNDTLYNFDGREIALLFTLNYGEHNKDENGE